MLNWYSGDKNMMQPCKMEKDPDGTSQQVAVIMTGKVYRDAGLKHSKHPKVEGMLYDKLCQIGKHKLRDDVRKLAVGIALNVADKEFQPTVAWLDDFMRRFCLSKKTMGFHSAAMLKQKGIKQAETIKPSTSSNVEGMTQQDVFTVLGLSTPDTDGGKDSETITKQNGSTQSSESIDYPSSNTKSSQSISEKSVSELSLTSGSTTTATSTRTNDVIDCKSTSQNDSEVDDGSVKVKEHQSKDINSCNESVSNDMKESNSEIEEVELIGNSDNETTKTRSPIKIGKISIRKLEDLCETKSDKDNDDSGKGEEEEEEEGEEGKSVDEDEENSNSNEESESEEDEETSSDEESNEVIQEIPEIQYSKAENKYINNNKDVLQKKLQGSVLKCTRCNQQVNHHFNSLVFTHPALGILMCKKCYKYYGNGKFRKDKEGYDEYCRLCAEGGDLLCCEQKNCFNGFCKPCIKRTMGRTECKRAEKAENWMCYVCDPTPLQEHRALHRIVLENLKVSSEEDKELSRRDLKSKTLKNKFECLKQIRQIKSKKEQEALEKSSKTTAAKNNLKKKRITAEAAKNNGGNATRKNDQKTADDDMSDIERSKACPVLLSVMNEMQAMLSKCLENVKLVDSKWKKSKYSSEGTKKARYRILKQLEAMKENFDILHCETAKVLLNEEEEAANTNHDDKEMETEKIEDGSENKPIKEKKKNTSESKEDKKNSKDVSSSNNDQSTVDNDEVSIKGPSVDDGKTNTEKEDKSEDEDSNAGTSNDKDTTNTHETCNEEEYSQDSSKGQCRSVDHEESLPDLTDMIKEVISDPDPDDPMDVDKDITSLNLEDNEVLGHLTSSAQREETTTTERSTTRDLRSTGRDLRSKSGTRRPRSNSSSDSNAESAIGEAGKKSTSQCKRRKYNVGREEASQANETEELNDKDDEGEGPLDKDAENNDDDGDEEKNENSKRQRRERDSKDKDRINDIKMEESNDNNMREGEEEDEEDSGTRKKKARKENEISNKKEKTDGSSTEEETAGKRRNKKAKEETSATSSGRRLRKKSSDINEDDERTTTATGKQKKRRKSRKVKKTQEEDKEGDALLGLVSQSESSSEDEEEEEEREDADEETKSQLEGKLEEKKGMAKKIKTRVSDSDNEEKEDRKIKTEGKKISECFGNGDVGSEAVKEEDKTFSTHDSSDENERAKNAILNSEEDNDKEESTTRKQTRQRTKAKHQGKSKQIDDSEIENEEEEESSKKSNKKTKKELLSDDKKKEEEEDNLKNGVSDKEDTDTDREQTSKRKVTKTLTRRKRSTATERKNQKAKLAILGSDSDDDGEEDKPKPRSKKKEYKRHMARKRRGKCNRKLNMEDIEGLQEKQLEGNCQVKLKVLPNNVRKILEEEEFVFASDYPDLSCHASETDRCEADGEESDREFSRLMKSTDGMISSRRSKPKPKCKRTKEDKASSEEEESAGKNESNNDDGENARGKDTKKDKVNNSKNSKKEGLMDININEDEEEANEDDEEEGGSKKKKRGESVTLNEKMKHILLMSSDEEAGEDEDNDDNEDEKDKSKELEKEAEKEKEKHEKRKEKEKKKMEKGEDSDEEDAPRVYKKGYVNLNISTDEEEDQEKSKEKEDDEEEPESAYEEDSDFEESPRKRRLFQISSSESESESKGNKRKAKKEESSEVESEEEEDAPKTKRKRIRKMSSSSNDDEDDDEVTEVKESPNKHKKIRKVMKDEDLKETTRNATQEEEDRRKRIEERQKRYNDIFMIDVETDQSGMDKLVLDFDPETKEELVSVHEKLVKFLKPHQFKGIKFMWDATVESIDQLRKNPGGGCILAHSMGLGKTLQVITFCHTMLTNKKISKEIQRIMVCCPVNTIFNWVAEFNNWLKGKMLPFDVIELASAKDLWGRAYRLDDWWNEGGICIIGYNMFRNLSNAKNKKYKGKMKEIFQKTLLEPGPDMVVCDEGHLLKNEKTALAIAINKVRTKRRIILTGTPLQNNLKEYHCMIQFVKPNLLGTKKEFMNRFANPIEQGQCVEAMPRDVRRMKRRAHILHNLLEGCVQRYDYTVLKPYLPPKFEYVISVQLSPIQHKLYQYYLDNLARGGPKRQGSGLFVDFGALSRVWTHPKVLELAMRRARDNDDEEDDEMEDFICDDTSSSESSDDERSRKKNKSKKKEEESDKEEEEPIEDETEKPEPIPGLTESGKVRMDWWRKIVIDTAGEDFEEEGYMDKLEHGGKIILLLDILRECCSIGDKVLLFSQSLLTLDMIEDVLNAVHQGEVDLPTFEDSLPIPYKKWKQNTDYLRLDGSTPPDMRKSMCRTFNDKNNDRCRLFLISTRAGGLGINLVGANRVIIFDSSWNPSHDTQSIFRVYRFGQTKPCYIYRFVSQGTMEEKIYSRQVAKMSTALRVVDEHQIKRYFKMEELAQLYEFNPADPDVRETPNVPNDRLLAELLQRQKDWIVTYHEHESLLENQTSEELSEEERKAAWEDYENEKKGLLMQNHRVMPVMGVQTMGHPGLPNLSLSTFSFENVVNTIKAQNPNLSTMELCRSVLLATKQIQKVHLNHYQRVQAMIYNLKNPMIAPEQRKLLPFGNHPEMLPVLEGQLRLLEENITRENQVINHIDEGTTLRNQSISAANMMSAGLVRGQPVSSGMSSATVNYVERPSTSTSARPSTSKADKSQEQNFGSNDVVLLD